MSKHDETVRQSRMVFYKDDIDKIDRILQEFLRLTSAKSALLIDKEGHMVTKQGSTSAFDVDTISALVAGSFAATKQMAKLLGEEEFSVMFHQGKKDNIQLSLIGDRTILAAIFDDKTTVGMVRLYAAQMATKLAVLFKDMSGRKQQPEGMSKEYGDAAKNKLDDVFGS